MTDKHDASARRGVNTALVHAGRNPGENFGIVNPPVYHTSTILWPTVADAQAKSPPKDGTKRYRYGRLGTPTMDAFEEVVAELEGAAGAVSVSSGLAAITTALMSVLEFGDHLLMVDSAYGPSRAFCQNVLRKLGISVSYYDPMIGAGIADMITPKTKVIYLESPGSITFEVQDTPAIVAVAKEHGLVTMIDNTWATPLFFRPLDLGVDLSIHAATKYFVGHSDAMMGVIAARTPELDDQVRECRRLWGQCAGPDDLYLSQRGMRTLAVRLRHVQDAALAVAHHLADRPEVAEVLHPAFENCPGHAFWKRDFTGSSGLFSIVLSRRYSTHAMAAMLDNMSLFPMGASWGGYESLVMWQRPGQSRTATSWDDRYPVLRLQIGLEDVDDLIADLDAGFERLSAADREAAE